MTTSLRQTPPLTIDYRALDALALDPTNPRTHSKTQIGQIAKSIRSFGFGVPILVDAEDKVLCGHGRIEAARLIGLESVPLVYLAHLTAAEAKAFQIADNRLTELGGWNEVQLAQTLHALSLQDLSFELDATGFQLPEIDLKISGLSLVGDEATDEEEAPCSGPAVTRPGDLWRLGPHRLLCGDALNRASYDQLMGETLAAIVFTDPPYNVAVQGHVGGRGRIKHREFAMASGEMSADAFQAFLDNALVHLAQHSRPGAMQYLCMDWRHITQLIAAGAKAFGELKNLCVWAKTAAGQGAFYRCQHELVAVFKLSGGDHTNNVQLGRFGRNRSNLWSYPSPARFGAASEDGSLLKDHPTPKPVAMVADALMDASHRGEVVLDPFLGGGATLMAAEQVGRVCRGLEIDPLYVDATVRRWMRATGKAAVRDADGLAFAQLEQKGNSDDR